VPELLHDATDIFTPIILFQTPNQ